MNNIPAQTNKGFFIWALILLLLALVGFWPSYFLPLSQCTFNYPVSMIHWHVVFTFAWLLLLVIQPGLKIKKQMHWHRRLGLLGLFLALGLIITGYQVQVQFMQHYFQLNETSHAVQLPFFRLITLLVFTLCFFFAMLFKDRAWHKRLLILGTMTIMQAGFARLYLNYWGELELAGLYGAITHVVVMVLFVIWDRMTHGRFHPASLWGSVMITLLVFGTAPLAESSWWSGMAHWMVSLNP